MQRHSGLFACLYTLGVLLQKGVLELQHPLQPLLGGGEKFIAGHLGIGDIGAKAIAGHHLHGAKILIAEDGGGGDPGEIRHQIGGDGGEAVYDFCLTGEKDQVLPPRLWGVGIAVLQGTGVAVGEDAPAMFLPNIDGIARGQALPLEYLEHLELLPSGATQRLRLLGGRDPGDDGGFGQLLVCILARICTHLSGEFRHHKVLGDVQAFMATYRKAEAVVEKYNRELAAWERQVREKQKPAQKEQAKPPERESVLKRLRQLQIEGKQRNQPRQRKKSFDRDSR